MIKDHVTAQKSYSCWFMENISENKLFQSATVVKIAVRNNRIGSANNMKIFSSNISDARRNTFINSSRVGELANTKCIGRAFVSNDFEKGDFHSG